ncbi:hypothetical protein [Acuticoccus mangrovi]|uniref:hypothetical protein n=1 Tax=Acuticoccus mangrovi TaxID=2796142 RepID=UPI001E407089|nr:hypothetical protein [Acuticoccus mangrovi]
MLRFAVLAVVLLVGGCINQYRGEPRMWFASHDGVAPREAGRVSVCHGFGCQLKTGIVFNAEDLAEMGKVMGTPETADEERASIAKLIAWMETRVAEPVGSADDIGGLDLYNAGKAGQMDCLDEASNTTSYLMVANEAGLLRFHKVGGPVARGFFLDGRYPHATAVVVSERGTPWAVDSWPNANGVEPDVMPLAIWFKRSSAR